MFWFTQFDSFAINASCLLFGVCMFFLRLTMAKFCSIYYMVLLSFALWMHVRFVPLVGRLSQQRHHWFVVVIWTLLTEITGNSINIKNRYKRQKISTNWIICNDWYWYSYPKSNPNIRANRLNCLLFRMTTLFSMQFWFMSMKRFRCVESTWWCELNKFNERTRFFFCLSHNIFSKTLNDNNTHY